MVPTAEWDSAIPDVPREGQSSFLPVAGGTFTEGTLLRGLTPTEESSSPAVTNFPKGCNGASQTLGREDTGFF